MATRARGRSRGRARRRETDGDEDPPRRPGEAQQYGQQEMGAAAPSHGEQIPSGRTAFRSGGVPRDLGFQDVPLEHSMQQMQLEEQGYEGGTESDDMHGRESWAREDNSGMRSSERSRDYEDRGYRGRDRGYSGRDREYSGRDREYSGRDREYSGRDREYRGRGRQDYGGRDGGSRGRDGSGRGGSREGDRGGSRGRDAGGRGRDGGGRGRGGRGRGRGGGGRGRQERQRRDSDMIMLTDEITTKPATCQDKRGSAGKAIMLQTNFFQLNSGPHWNLYQYHIDFLPYVDSRRYRMMLVASLANVLGQTRAFDGMILYLPIRLPNEVTELVTNLEPSGEKITLKIKLTNELPPTSPTCIQMYNVIFKRLFTMIDMQQVGKNFFNPSVAVDIPQHNLSVWPGFVTSILQYEKHPLLCVDISHKLLRIDTVLDMMTRLYETLERKHFYEACIRKLVGGVVLTRYNNKTYRIDDIDWDSNPNSTFDTKDGPLSYKDYYKKAYNKDITDPHQPLLVSRPKAKERKMGKKDIRLIPEFCVLTGLTDEIRTDTRVMQDVAQHTRVPPSGRVKKLEDFMKKLNATSQVQKELDGWGLKFSDNLVRIGARQLPREDVYLRDDKYALPFKQEDADWGNELRSARLLTTVNMNVWMVVCPRRIIGQAQDLCQALMKAGPPTGIQFEQPYVYELSSDRNEEYLKAIRNNLTRDTQMVLCVLPATKKDRYDAIKKVCCDSHPVPSQCVTSRTLSKKNTLMSVATKILLQLNCKLGGELWRVHIPMRNAMVIGIDTYHDSARKGRSVGGVVCSINMNLTRYYSRCTFQHTAQELIDGLRVCVHSALKKYHELNHVLPDKIIVYRDGVGDGQLPVVFQHEVPQLVEELCRVGGQGYKVKLAVVVVKKRINCRLFKVDPNGVSPPSNPTSGTIVDTEITKPNKYDFFLVSQSVRQGTVSPTSYIVVEDTTGLQPDHIQRLTYKMTHLYYNWPGTIRVPAPCQYAHKLAFLVGQSIHKEPSEDLANRLYFL